MHRTGARGIGEGDDPVAQMPLKGHGATVQAIIGEHRVKRRGGKAGGRLGLDPGGVAKLHLTAAVGQLFGNHPVAAGPAVVKPVGMAGGISGASAGHDQPGEMFVAGAAGAVLAVADAGRPGGTVHLELAAPAAGEIDHLVAGLGRRKDRGREPVQVHRRGRLDLGPCLDHMGLRIDREQRAIAQHTGLIAKAQGQPGVVFLGAVEAELGQEGLAGGIADHQPGLAGKAARRLGAERQLRVGIEHAAGHVDGMGPGQGLQVFVVGQARPPVDHLGEVVFPGSQHQRLTGVIQTPALDHFTAPRVRPAMKWRCIRKNISTGGRAATIDPAETRCQAATHWPLSE